MGSWQRYKSMLQGTHPSPTSPPHPVHPCHVRLRSACTWAFSTFPYSLEPGFAGVTAFGKLPKDPLPLHSLRPQDHFVAGRASLYLPHYPNPLTCSRPFLPCFHHLARLLIARSSQCFGFGYTCFNSVSQIRAWTLRRTRQTNHGGPSLQASYPLAMHAVCVGYFFLCAFPFL